MKIALLSDLHANRQATESVWAHAQSEGVDQLVLLGDYVDYGADPAWVIDFVRDQVAHGAIAVKGNHDDAVVADEDNPDMAGHVLPSLKWTRQQLGADTLTLIVGQRVASLRTCDRILVLDKGRVIGEGPHQHLLTHCPAYAEIVASQSGTGEAA